MRHISVLLEESIRGLDLKPGSVFVDATLGSAGHSIEVVKLLGGNVTIVGFDLDRDALARSEALLKDSGVTPILIHASFASLKAELVSHGIGAVDAILFDLGISSVQLDDSGRGFSFKRDEPLQMTLLDHPGDDTLTAYDVVNSWEEDSLQAIFRGFGEEKFSGRIARAIVEARKIAPITTTFQLINVIEQAVPKFYTRGKIHFATRTFQAIRIAVNGELGAIEHALPQALEVLKPGGRIAVITFHSLEDRIVKHFYKEAEDRGLGVRITKKPIVPSEEEIKNNSRSRSAKLRILKKV